MTIPKLTPYTGQVANPDGSQTQSEFTTNMFNQLSYEANLATELDATIDGMNNAVDEVNQNAALAENSANAAEAAASLAGYKGLWPDTGGSAEKGDTYQTQVGGTPTGEYYTALKNTSIDPVDDNVNWKAQVSKENIKAAEERGLGHGASLYQGTGTLNGESYVQNGDTVPAGTTHLTVLINSKPEDVAISPLASGVVSALTETGATISVTPVVFYPVENYFSRDQENIRVERAQVLGDRPYGSQAQRRDGYVALRTVSGNSNCHGFADSTVIEPSDVGTYGAFDVTTTMRTAGSADHSYAYQARNNFDGQSTGTLSNLGAVFVDMTAQDGDISTVFGMKMTDVVKTNATVTNISGIDIGNLNATDNAYGAHIFQNQDSAINSYALFSDGDAPSYHKGNLVLGYSTTEVFPVTFTQTDGTVAGFGADTSAGAYFGSGQDVTVAFYAAGERRLSIENAGGGLLAVNPRSNADTYLGVMGLAYNTIYLDTAPVITSDEEHKTPITPLSETLKKVGSELAGKIGTYKMLNAIAKKGDSARTHFGIGAQTIIEVFENNGLNAFEFGVVCYEEWEDQFRKTQINYGEKKTVTEIKERQKYELEEYTWVEDKLELVGDKYVKTEVSENRTRSVPIYNSIPVVNTDGSPVLNEAGEQEFIQIPVMEEYEHTTEVPADPIYENVLVRAAGSQYSVRYDELYALLIASLV